MATELAVTRGRLADSPANPLPELLAGRQVFVASNRGPVHHRMRDGQMHAVPASGGLVTALSSLTEHLPVTWVSTAIGAADRIVAQRPARTPASPGQPRLRFAQASDEAVLWSYHRFANPILWFLQHQMWDRLQPAKLTEGIQRGWRLGYSPLCAAHARTLAKEVAGAFRPLVLVQDYHLYLVPSLLRRLAPSALIQHFTHIPWPSPGHWQPLPAAIRQQICTGLLGADIAGFQTYESAHNFLRSCERFVPGAKVDYARSAVWYDEQRTLVRDYPISVDTRDMGQLAGDPRVVAYKKKLYPRQGERLIVRVDRMDPSKNIPLGFRAFERLLEHRADLMGKVRFLAFLVPSREAIPEYRQHADEVFSEVDRINARFARDNWQPIQVFHEENRLQAMAGMAVADVLLVNPLADGMNLVAKEGPLVSERAAVLVLSQECGAHVQLGHAALSIPPRDVTATADALGAALEMRDTERQIRLHMLRRSIEDEDLTWWATRQVEDLLAA